MERPNLEAIKARAQAADKAICAVAQNANHFRMSIPPQPDDTDTLIVGLAREDVPAMAAYIEQLEHVLPDGWLRSGPWTGSTPESPSEKRPDLRAIEARAKAGLRPMVIRTASNGPLLELVTEDVPALVAYVRQLEQERDILRLDTQPMLFYHEEITPMTPELWDRFVTRLGLPRDRESMVILKIAAGPGENPHITPEQAAALPTAQDLHKLASSTVRPIALAITVDIPEGSLDPILAPDFIRDQVAAAVSSEALRAMVHEDQEWLARGALGRTLPTSRPTLDEAMEVLESLYPDDDADEVPTPRPGDTVHYVLSGLAGESPEGAIRPAIVIETRDKRLAEDPEVVLVVQDLAVFTHDGVLTRCSIQYDPDRRPGSWHWPE